MNCISEIIWNEHQEVAKAYEQMKIKSWEKYGHDRDGYTNAKTAFVEKWTLEARKIYGDRYDRIRRKMKS